MLLSACLFWAFLSSAGGQQQRFDADESVVAYYPEKDHLNALSYLGEEEEGQEGQEHIEYDLDAAPDIDGLHIETPDESKQYYEDSSFQDVTRALRGQRNRKYGRMGMGSRPSKKKKKGIPKDGKSIRRNQFLDRNIVPRPFINCIPVPPGRSIQSRKGGKKSARMSRRRQSQMSSKMYSMYSRDSASKSRRLKGGSSSGSMKGSRRGRKGMGMGRMGMGRKRLPFCPLDTEAPTFLPTVTPFPTYTALRK